MGLLDRLKKITNSLQRTQQSFNENVVTVFEEKRPIDEAFWEELEEALIYADMGYTTTQKLITSMRQRVREERMDDAAKAKRVFKEELIKLLQATQKGTNVDAARASSMMLKPGQLNVILVVGVNGTGKTTTIAKLAHLMDDMWARTVLLAAADTFRAAAIDQLKIWGERVQVPVVAMHQGSDPAAVIYAGMEQGMQKHADVLLVDTAGRLHTKINLMEELRKIKRVIQKLDETAPHEVLLVIDAPTGQNALTQAKAFLEAVDVTGIVLTKLDSSAKGGVAFAITQELGLPIKFVGTGEKVDDISEFDARTYVEGLLGEPAAVA